MVSFLEGTKMAAQLASLRAVCREATLTYMPRAPCTAPTAAKPGKFAVREGTILPGETARAGAEKGQILFGGK